MKKIVDGNIACSNIAYLFSEVCSIYPITPSSPMASNVDELIDTESVNIFDSKPTLIEMQSEAGAAGAMHGALLTGSLATTFTASQGLLLMIPNMYKMAGEGLPGVIHVAARSLATHALSIFGDHQDIYATRQTGFCILASSNVEDAQNLAAVAHLSAIELSLPFLHFFDGFRTSHELNTISQLDKTKLKELVNFSKLEEYKNKSLNINKNKQCGMAENEDIYFQSTEARNNKYNGAANVVNNYMEKINAIAGTNYEPFKYYGSDTATNIIVAMGSVCDTIKEVINKSEDNNIGLIEVHLYRPFSIDYLLKVLPSTATNIAVLDRTKEAGSVGEPLYLDVAVALKDKNINVVGGRYGLSSKNTTPSDINDVYKMLEGTLKNNFTIGIVDDVTNLSLEKTEYNIKEDTDNILIYGFGSDGMVSASKNLLKLLHKKEDIYVQGYFEYDSKKSGGVTVSNLRFSKEKINKPYYITSSKLVAVTKYEYFSKLNMLNTLEENGILLINTNKDEKEINETLPIDVKKYIMDNNIKCYYIDASKIALENNIKGKISKIFEYLILKLLNKDYEEDIINSIKTLFLSKGEEVINNNINALNSAKEGLKILNIDSSTGIIKKDNENIYELINNREGNSLKVSDVMEISEGLFPCGLTKKEKRKISNFVPSWNKNNCIQCAQCSLVCPHAVIRPIVNNEADGNPLFGKPEYNFSIKISEADCTGCELCVKACPGKAGIKALEMKEVTTYKDVTEYFENHINPEVADKFTIKGSQLQKPLFEFSGACAGCGETPYIKLLTQLFGKNNIIANATGCSSIYGGSAPSTPYSIPWANSLFEDNAEFALGMNLSFKQKRNRLRNVIESNINSASSEVKELLNTLLDNFNDIKITNEINKKLDNIKLPHDLELLREYIPERMVWAVGGDGWAYDIGYGGIDHVIHSNENVKILILDTEVYSNTGGQASKASKIGAVAEFANMGKENYKKDLFKIATCAPNCYVASVSLGANMMHTIKAFKEAAEHNGPAVIIAYSPCIEHGIKNGMSSILDTQKLAVEAGYSLLMRYNPLTEKLTLDSKEPNFEKYLEFLNSEVRFNSLYIKDKDIATKLFDKQKNNAIKRYNYYKKINEEN